MSCDCFETVFNPSNETVLPLIKRGYILFLQDFISALEQTDDAGWNDQLPIN